MENMIYLCIYFVSDIPLNSHHTRGQEPDDAQTLRINFFVMQLA